MLEINKQTKLIIFAQLIKFRELANHIFFLMVLINDSHKFMNYTHCNNMQYITAHSTDSCFLSTIFIESTNKTDIKQSKVAGKWSMQRYVLLFFFLLLLFFSSFIFLFMCVLFFWNFISRYLYVYIVKTL